MVCNHRLTLTLQNNLLIPPKLGETELMYRVIAYEHPIITVLHTDGTTYRFSVNDRGELLQEGRDLNDARRAAIAYLVSHRRLSAEPLQGSTT